MSRLWPDQPLMVVLLGVTVWREKNNKKHVHHNHCQKVPIALLMNWVNAAIFPGAADPIMDKVLHRGGSARNGSVGFEATSFWRKSLIGPGDLLKQHVSLQGKSRHAKRVDIISTCLLAEYCWQTRCSQGTADGQAHSISLHERDVWASKSHKTKGSGEYGKNALIEGWPRSTVVAHRITGHTQPSDSVWRLWEGCHLFGTRRLQVIFAPVQTTLKTCTF